MSRDLYLENIRKAQEEIDKQKVRVKSGKMRQKYHFMAETGWINDPNGLIFFKGKYHVFYQHNPFNTHWSTMYWGHAVSEDMLHWKYVPVALAPSEDYDNHVNGGCFSGSAIEHNGNMYLFYTGVADHGDGLEQVQCMAYSEDGIHFEKYEKNPIILPPDGYLKSDFRDPKVWSHQGEFYMICGARKDNLGQILLYKSKDLLTWEYVNVLIESRGELGTMFECPDIYQIDNKYVLMFSPIGLHERTSMYLVGDMDYKTGKFDYGSMGEIDWGFDFYAPQSFQDANGRRIIMAWANGWDWMPWWNGFGPTEKEGWCGSYTIPREVRLASDGKLQFIPIEEMKELRDGGEKLFDIEIGETPFSIALDDCVSFELKACIDLEKTTAKVIKVSLRGKGEKQTIISYHLQQGEMSFDRNQSDVYSQGMTRSPLWLANCTELDIHIFSDQSSIEVFSNSYKTNHTCNVFPSDEQNENMIWAEGGSVYFKKIAAWNLKKPTLDRDYL